MKFFVEEYDKPYEWVFLYLDPEDRSVYTFAAIGSSGTPAKAFHNLHLGIGGLPAGFVGATLEAWLQTQEPALEALCASYEGTSWDGSNHVGVWSEDTFSLSLAFTQTLARAIDLEGDISYYIDAKAFFADTDTAEKQHLLAIDRDEAIAEMVSELEHNAGMFLRVSDCSMLLDKWEKEMTNE